MSGVCPFVSVRRADNALDLPMPWPDPSSFRYPDSKATHPGVVTFMQRPVLAGNEDGLLPKLTDIPQTTWHIGLYAHDFFMQAKVLSSRREQHVKDMNARYAWLTVVPVTRICALLELVYSFIVPRIPWIMFPIQEKVSMSWSRRLGC